MRFSFAFVTLVVGFLSALSASADVLRMHGSTTVVANIMEPYQQAIEKTSGHKLTVIGNGSGRGLQDLVAGKAELGMISAPLETTVKKIKKKNPGFDASGLQAHQVGETKVAFVVHPSNPVKSLTRSQIVGILGGKIKNWQEVGGRPMPIVIICEDSNGGLRAMTEKAMLGGASIHASAKQVPNGGQVSKIAAQMPMAFGVAAAATVDSKIREVATDFTIAQPLIFVTRGNPTAQQRAIIDAANAVGG